MEDKQNPKLRIGDTKIPKTFCYGAIGMMQTSFCLNDLLFTIKGCPSFICPLIISLFAEIYLS